MSLILVIIGMCCYTMALIRGLTMRVLIDLTGLRFGKTTVLAEVAPRVTSHGTYRYWDVLCDCGKHTEVSTANLKKGHHTQCNYCKNSAPRKHGLCGTKIYGVHNAIIQRLTNPKNARYHRYGGRGISIYEPWKDAETFISWAYANGYKEGLTIDRIDNDGNYEPSNCRWVPRAVNNLNRSY